MTRDSLAQKTSSVEVTAYGPVDAAALRALQATFDTADMLVDVDKLAEAGMQLLDPNGLRADLLRLHGMAHAVINGAPLVTDTMGVSLADSAVDLDAALDDLVRVVMTVRDRVRAIAALSPADD